VDARVPRKAVVRAADLGPPRPIDDEDFAEICATSAIRVNQHEAVRDFLDEAVTGFGDYLRGERALPSREADRLAIMKAAKDLRRAQQRLKKKTGPAGRLGLKMAGRQMAPMISASWMRRRFPGDPAVPDPIYWPVDNRSGRTPARTPARPIDTDDLSLGQRIGFMRQRSALATVALLGDIADALEAGRLAIVHLPDGRKPLECRAFMLAALAELWHRLGRKPTSGINSKFGAFCEAVFEAIGWPTKGVNYALSEAIALWRSRYR
jgi:hypothetical protein